METSADVANLTGEIRLHFQPLVHRCELLDISVCGFCSRHLRLTTKDRHDQPIDE